MQLEFVMGTALEAPALCDWSSHLGAYKEQTTGFVLPLQSNTKSFARSLLIIRAPISVSLIASENVCSSILTLFSEVHDACMH